MADPPTKRTKTEKNTGGRAVGRSDESRVFLDRLCGARDPYELLQTDGIVCTDAVGRTQTEQLLNWANAMEAETFPAQPTAECAQYRDVLARVRRRVRIATFFFKGDGRCKPPLRGIFDELSRAGAGPDIFRGHDMEPTYANTLQNLVLCFLRHHGYARVHSTTIVRKDPDGDVREVDGVDGKDHRGVLIDLVSLHKDGEGFCYENLRGYLRDESHPVSNLFQCNSVWPLLVPRTEFVLFRDGLYCIPEDRVYPRDSAEFAARAEGNGVVDLLLRFDVPAAEVMDGLDRPSAVDTVADTQKFGDDTKAWLRAFMGRTLHPRSRDDWQVSPYLKGATGPRGRGRALC